MTTPMARLLTIVAVAALALGSVSCSNKAKPKTTPEPAPVQAATPTTPPPQEAPPPAAEPFQNTDVDKSNVVEPGIDELNRQGVLRTVYFGYNSNELDDTAKATMQADAAWLKAHAKYNIEIGGHCDERGSIGYNVALGDRRATAVKEYLATLGVDGGRLVPISYGEEKPADPGHDEAAWSKNRRAEFTIKQ
jgi:peptidoglycan-associated lipoprotein